MSEKNVADFTEELEDAYESSNGSFVPLMGNPELDEYLELLGAYREEEEGGGND